MLFALSEKIKELVSRRGNSVARNCRGETAPPTIHVIAVAYKKFGQLRVFVQSWLNQTRPNWHLTVIHDGPDPEFDAIMLDFQHESPDRIEFRTTHSRFNDYGHSLREEGLRQIKGDYVLLTNADNYFVPRAIEYINEAFAGDNPDVVMFNMIHSHDRPGGRNLPAYSFFETKYKRGSIDMSAAIVKANLAVAAGFRDKAYDGDATYFEDVARIKGAKKLSISKIRRVLFVHN